MTTNNGVQAVNWRVDVMISSWIKNIIFYLFSLLSEKTSLIDLLD